MHVLQEYQVLRSQVQVMCYIVSRVKPTKEIMCNIVSSVTGKSRNHVQHRVNCGVGK